MCKWKEDKHAHIYEKYNYTCQYCGLSANNDFDQWMNANLTIDHIVPTKHGGKDIGSNKVVACFVCNKLKGQEPCVSVEEGKVIVNRKREEYREWFYKYVHKNT